VTSVWTGGRHDVVVVLEKLRVREQSLYAALMVASRCLRNVMRHVDGVMIMQEAFDKREHMYQNKYSFTKIIH
jgi:hypothetical protein